MQGELHGPRCPGHRRRQCRPVRGPDGARGRPQRAAAGGGAARLARRQFRPHAQPALHARRAPGRAGRGLPRRGVLAGPAQGHGRHHQRAPGAHGDPCLLHLPRLDAPPRRAFPAAAVGRAACGAHQCLLHGRRQGAGQCLLPQRRTAGRADPLRVAGGPASRSRTVALSRCRLGGRAAHHRKDLRAGGGRLRVQPRVAARGLGAERSAANGRPTTS